MPQDDPSTFRDPYLMRARGVTKRYDDVTAVDGVDLDIVPGEIFALLGPNGAGKTTLIGCITGLITRFDGDIAVAGYDVRDDYRITRRLVGLVPQELNYDPFFSVRQVLEYQGGYFGRRATRARADELLERFALADKVDANTRWLSGGMKRRLMICKALMHEPVLLFLDEPTAGVDVELRAELWEYVRGLRERGTTIVLTTHYIEEAEQLADRVGIINRGRLLRVARREQLMAEFGTRHLEVDLVEPIPDGLLARLDALDLEQTGRCRLRLVYEERQAHSATDRSPVQVLLDGLADAGLAVETITGGRTSLEQVFREVLSADEMNQRPGGER